MAIGAGLTFGCLAYNGHCQNKKEQEYIEKQIKFIQELPICVKITEGGFMSDSEEEEESKEDE